MYLVVAALFLAAELFYFWLAERFFIIDNPNERSSHAHPTIRGGGVIFIIAAVSFSLWNGFMLPWLMAGLLLSGIVSFVDDIRSLPNWGRFLSHGISALMLLYQADLFFLNPLFIFLIVILMIAVMNAYNFMDGINGITGFYTLAILLPLLFTEGNESLRQFGVFMVLGLLVFLFFNARVKARCFAGDVGSIGISIIVLFFLITRIYSTGNINYIGFLLLYGIDAGLTIGQRLFQKENIFRAHRKHLFQLFCNEQGAPHVLMSVIYASLQLLINIFILQWSRSGVMLFWLILFGSVIYIAIKLMVYRSIRQKEI
jgi:UDP-GlcNAc:undecaprenyl-phosphate GlcNAc-1-phosphate transferase